MKKHLLHQKRIHNLPEVISLEEEKMLAAGVPIQKIIGFIDFDDLKINVDHEVLIPRYETQEVLMEALKYVKKDSKVLDLCCGSGYIGLSIKQKTGADVTLSDLSDEAIKQTTENAKMNNLEVKVIKSDLFESIGSKFDLIVSNPPYIPNKNILDESVTKHEPHMALFGGEDGNDFYKRIIEKAPEYLNEGGHLVFEISPDNLEYIKSEGFEIFKDINGKERIAVKKF